LLHHGFDWHGVVLVQLFALVNQAIDVFLRRLVHSQIRKALGPEIVFIVLACGRLKRLGLSLLYRLELVVCHVHVDINHELNGKFNIIK